MLTDERPRLIVTRSCQPMTTIGTPGNGALKVR